MVSSFGVCYSLVSMVCSRGDDPSRVLGLRIRGWDLILDLDEATQGKGFKPK